MKSVTQFFTTESRDYALPLIVNGIGYHYLQDEIRRPEGYDAYQLLWTAQGKGMFHHNGEDIILDENKLLLTLPDQYHHYYPVEEPWIVHWVTFIGHGVQDILGYLHLDNTLILPTLGASAYIQAMVDILDTSAYLLKTELAFTTMNYLNTLARSHLDSPQQTAVRRRDKLKRVLEYIDHHYQELITLSQLAALAGMSQQHLCVLFKETLHLRPFDYINNVRINHCKTQLIQSKNASIRDISLACGYENVCYFNQVFKKKTGMSPTQFRMLH